MNIAIQLLNFNETNSTDDFLKSLIPSQKDIDTYNKQSRGLENYLSDREYKRQGITDEDIVNETDESLSAFGILELDPELDLGNLIEEDEFNKAENDCKIDKFYDCIVFRKDKVKSFNTLLILFSQMEQAGIYTEFLDIDFNSVDIEAFIQLIGDKMKFSKPIVLHYVYYCNE